MKYKVLDSYWLVNNMKYDRMYLVLNTETGKLYDVFFNSKAKRKQTIDKRIEVLYEKALEQVKADIETTLAIETVINAFNSKEKSVV